MLDISDNVLILRALDQTTDQRAGENRVFAKVFEIAAIARLARKINSATEGHVVTLRPQFAPDQRAIFIGGIRVPAGGGCRIAR